jgi:hypothetical protein
MILVFYFILFIFYFKRGGRKSGATPLPKNGVASRPLGVVRPPPKGQKKKKKNWGGLATPKSPNPFFLFFFLVGLLGWSSHSQKLKPILSVFFFLVCLSGWPDHPQRPGGGFSHPIPAIGGGRSHPDFLPPLFNFPSLKKKKTKILNWPKLHRFEKNDIILLEPKMT